MSTTSATKLCAVIGAPVAHSLSPAMHNAAFAYLGLDYVYAACAVANVPAAIVGAAALGFAGLNVTVPHKESALVACAPDAIARAVGAVNTITFDRGRAFGTNTDVVGLEHAIDALVTMPLRRAVVFGAGGAARAALYVLFARGVSVSVCSRRSRRLEVGGRQLVASAISDLGPAGIEQIVAEADLIIDSTPLGLADGAFCWPIAAAHEDAAVIDLVVRRETPVSRAAKARGLRVQVGDVMLLQQGVAAFERFTGVAAPVDVMRAALARAMEAT